MFCFIILLLLIYSRTTKSKRRMFCKRILEETKRNLKIVRSRVKFGKLNFFTNEIHHSETKPFSFFPIRVFVLTNQNKAKNGMSRKTQITKRQNLSQKRKKKFLDKRVRPSPPRVKFFSKIKRKKYVKNLVIILEDLNLISIQTDCQSSTLHCLNISLIFNI